MPPDPAPPILSPLWAELLKPRPELFGKTPPSGSQPGHPADDGHEDAAAPVGDTQAAR